MRKPIFVGAFPACFDSQQQYDDWAEMAHYAYAVAGPCTDCTPYFKTKMQFEHRCENPDIIFKTKDKGEIVGKFPEPM